MIPENYNPLEDVLALYNPDHRNIVNTVIAAKINSLPEDGARFVLSRLCSLVRGSMAENGGVADPGELPELVEKACQFVFPEGLFMAGAVLRLVEPDEKPSSLRVLKRRAARTPRTTSKDYDEELQVMAGTRRIMKLISPSLEVMNLCFGIEKRLGPDAFLPAAHILNLFDQRKQRMKVLKMLAAAENVTARELLAIMKNFRSRTDRVEAFLKMMKQEAEFLSFGAPAA